VQVCKCLLGLRGEEWQWVAQPELARWIVIDASRPLGAGVDHLIQNPHEPRRYIALAKSWAEVPSPHWAFFKLPLTPRSFFPWINQNLGLPASSYVDKELPSASAALLHQHMPWEGQWLRLKRWPNLSAYPGLPLDVVRACRQMLITDVSHAQLCADLGEAPALARLLSDAWQQDNLRISPAPPAGTASATNASTADAPSASGATRSSAAPPTSQREPGLFQRFLNRFR